VRSIDRTQRFCAVNRHVENSTPMSHDNKVTASHHHIECDIKSNLQIEMSVSNANGPA
jgi:hypothetical protein